MSFITPLPPVKRTIRKVMGGGGGGGKNHVRENVQNKIHARNNPKKRIHAQDGLQFDIQLEL